MTAPEVDQLQRLHDALKANAADWRHRHGPDCLTAADQEATAARLAKAMKEINE